MGTTGPDKVSEFDEKGEETVIDPGEEKEVEIGGHYKIDLTGEDLLDWYKRCYPGWFWAYPGYHNWTKVGYDKATEKVLADIGYPQKTLDLRTVKDFVDYVDFKRKKIGCLR
jgi:hypothetical protein